jgi:hypothetical protein
MQKLPLSDACWLSSKEFTPRFFQEAFFTDGETVLMGYRSDEPFPVDDNEFLFIEAKEPKRIYSSKVMKYWMPKPKVPIIPND